MAGPGIRYHYMAQVLSDNFHVTVGFFDPTYLPEDDFNFTYGVAHIDAHYFEKGFQGYDIVIAHWLSEAMIDYCTRNSIFLVFDFYVLGPVENLAGSIYSGRPVKHEHDFEYNRSLAMYRKFFQFGDVFLVSNRRQLDYWTGFIFGAGQIELSSYPKRPVYDRFIYAPMGIDVSAKLIHDKDVIKGVIHGIDRGDKVLLWTGGIWNHFDGKSLMEAMKGLTASRPDIKLVFFGTQHPNPNIPEMKESLDTRAYAKQLGIINKSVFFQDGWVKYPDRINYLLEADAAINTHKPSIETEFSHRTRVLDHLLAELPTISTEGDYLSDEVIKPLGLGITVEANNPKGLQEAILKVLDPKENKTIREKIKLSRGNFSWQESMNSLNDLLANNPSKLFLLASTKPPKTNNKAVRAAKKITPAPIKKIIVRTLRAK